MGQRDVVHAAEEEGGVHLFLDVGAQLELEAELGPQLWNDEGGLFNRGEKVAMWEAPTISGHPTTMALANSFDEPPATQVYWQLRPRFTPVEVRPLAMASRDVVPEPDAEADLLSLKQFEYVVVLDDDAQAGWWTVYSVRRPDRVGLVPKNYLKKIPTQLCVALYAWPQAGQPAAQGDLSFRPGDLVVATETNGAVPSIIERRPANIFLGHISPIFVRFFAIFSLFSPS